MAAPRIIPAVLNWKGLDPDRALVRGVTPAPKLEYLTTLNLKIQAACTQPYAMTGLAMYLERTSNQKVLAQQMVNIATKHLRAVVARGDGNGKTGAPAATDTHSVYGTTSGALASDEVLVPSPFSQGSEAWPPSTGSVSVAASAEVYEASPVAAMDRLLESPTATSLSAAVRERFEITRGLGCTVIPTMVQDLSTI